MGQIFLLIGNLLISFLLLLRTYEMLNHCYRTIKVLRNPDLNIWYVTTSWPITYYFKHIKILNSVYRLPVLIPVSSLLLTLLVAFFKWTPGQGAAWILIACSSVILISILVQMAQTLLSRIVFGSDDKYMRHWFTVIPWNDRSKIQALVTDEMAKRDMAVFLIGFVFLTIIGYAAIYLVTKTLYTDAFAGGKMSNFGDSLYFSAVTFATVGFGDIHPATTLSRLLVVSEIAVSLGTLVILILSYSLTLPENKS